MLVFCIRVCCCLLLLASVVSGQTLTRAVDLRSLPADRAMLGLPVEIVGTVSFLEIPGTIFIQDETGGTFFRTKAAAAVLKVGDQVKVKGVTVPGLYLTGIDAQTYERIGQGTAPAAMPATFEDLRQGRYHYQRVTVRGIGRQAAALEENRTLLNLALGSRVIEVRVDAPPFNLERLVDAELEITALAAGAINDRRQLVSPYLRVSDWSDIHVVSSAMPVDSLKPLSAARLLRFDPANEQGAGHRVRVAGRVIAAFADGQVFVRDEKAEIIPSSSPATGLPASTPLRPAAVAMRLAQPASLQPGQILDVAGFPNMDNFSASLSDAVILSATPEIVTEVMAVPVTFKELFSGALDADLVQLDAVLTELHRQGNGYELRLMFENRPLRAFLPEHEGSLTLEAGSLLRVTGICRVESSTDKGFRSQPDRAMLLLRGPNDLSVLQKPSWWTAQRLLAAVGVLGLLVLLGLLWITLLRRQVTKQGEALRERIAHEAMLEERQRIAREFHDTLEQELAGLSLRLDAATTRPLEDKARSLLDTSRHLVSRIQTEARNLVSDLRADPEAALDLSAALREIADRALDGLYSIHLEIEEPLPLLPAHTVHHLRMIAQEAVTNALKHAAAGQITLGLKCEEDHLTLTITDDGKGIDLAQTQGRAGHFGCMGIRERCLRIQAEVRWERITPHGTRVTVIHPLKSDS